MSQWKYFKVGPVEGTGLTILGVRWKARIQHETKYLVRHACCGLEEELTHFQIKARIRHSSPRCSKCKWGKKKERQVVLSKSYRKRKKAKQPVRADGPAGADYGFLVPPWSVPEGARAQLQEAERKRPGPASRRFR